MCRLSLALDRPPLPHCVRRGPFLYPKIFKSYTADMLTVPHVLVGAAIGSLIGDVPGAPAVAFAAGWASHYVMDFVPHWERLYRPFDAIDFETDTPAKDWPRHIFVQAALDVIVAGVILYAIWTNTGGASWWRTDQIFFAGLGAVVPDLLGNVPFWNKSLRRFSIFKREYAFHSGIHITDSAQRAVPRWLGLLTQVIAVTISLWILAR